MTDPNWIGISDVRDAVAEIDAAAAGDPEQAHVMEDALHLQVLRAIALGTHPKGVAPALANEALRTEDLDYPRWYA